MLSLSRRARELGTENAFVVLGEVAKLQAEGKDILSFCIGQPDFDTPDTIRLAGIAAITAGHTGYTPSPGIPALREAVASFFSRTRGVDVDAEEVVCACGGKPFIGYSILSVTDYGEGHEVIYPNPDRTLAHTGHRGDALEIAVVDQPRVDLVRVDPQVVVGRDDFRDGLEVRTRQDRAGRILWAA